MDAPSPEHLEVGEAIRNSDAIPMVPPRPAVNRIFLHVSHPGQRKMHSINHRHCQARYE